MRIRFLRTLTSILLASVKVFRGMFTDVSKSEMNNKHFTLSFDCCYLVTANLLSDTV